MDGPLPIKTMLFNLRKDPVNSQQNWPFYCLFSFCQDTFGELFGNFMKSKMNNSLLTPLERRQTDTTAKRSVTIRILRHICWISVLHRKLSHVLSLPHVLKMQFTKINRAVLAIVNL